jgi:Protein of unknown function (DUF4232)
MRMSTSHPTRLIGTVAVAVAALLAAFAALASTSVRAAPASAAATPKCRTSGLDIWFNNEGGGGTAGSIYYKLEFTNLSGHACTLRGYPGVSATDLGGRRIGRAASRDNFQAPGPVTLAAGASATATLRIVEAGNFPASSCHQVTAAGLRVYPPGQVASRLVPFPFQACPGTGPAVLSVRALTKA